MAALFPINRSLTGPGVVETLERISAVVPLQVTEVPSGTELLDWTVPDEWSLQGAHIADADGNHLIDVADHTLHVVSYSEPVAATLTRAELEVHLHSLPDRPDLIPYRTSYYSRTWGFCLTQHQREALGDGPFDVLIDSTLAPGTFRYGEAVIPGTDTEDPTEVIVSTHTCHPSMANDNCTGLVAVMAIGGHLLRHPPRRTHRLLFLPGTLGAIAWLAQNPDARERVHAGLVIGGLGDTDPLTFKASRRGDTVVDRVAHAVLPRRDASFRPLSFSPYGYDERQFCSPGFDLAVGRLSRGQHGEYPEYHTSGDDLAFVDADRVAEGISAALEILRGIDDNETLDNLSPYGEPQLGRRGLYSSTGGAIDSRSVEMAYLWVLSGSDGETDLVTIAERADLPIDAVVEAARRLSDAGLTAPRARGGH